MKNITENPRMSPAASFSVTDSWGVRWRHRGGKIIRVNKAMHDGHLRHRLVEADVLEDFDPSKENGARNHDVVLVGPEGEVLKVGIVVVVVDERLSIR